MIDKESIFELQKLDCNCNNCAFLERDLEKFSKWAEWHKDLELKQFEKDKEKAIREANLIEDPKERQGMLRVANKMKFQFDKSKLLNYGKCTKLKKDVSFIPNICQIETQDCFVHRLVLTPTK
jgi:hypothetical protein